MAVLFALDAAAHLDRPRGSAVRVSVVDPDTEEVMAAALHDAGPDGRRLPVAG
ncbi:hypothetical protein GCM10009716_20800 [Streptomyces sodiiphilus]|uniref:Uncharacterized protein n=1 Tax=Streptomyces sodiiphilus TaxID=226217 RepID=A0ABN2P367_9ACTN